MSSIITSDHPLSVPRQKSLNALLDTLIPASSDGNMPSATDVGFELYLQTQADELLPILRKILEDIGDDFPDQTREAQQDIIRHFSATNGEVFQAVLTRVYDCYYQNDAVRRKIGVVAGPLFPQGNTLEPGDLSLLDPVIAHSDQHEYRKPD